MQNVRNLRFEITQEVMLIGIVLESRHVVLNAKHCQVEIKTVEIKIRINPMQSFISKFNR